MKSVPSHRMHLTLRSFSYSRSLNLTGNNRKHHAKMSAVHQRQACLHMPLAPVVPLETLQLQRQHGALAIPPAAHRAGSFQAALHPKPGEAQPPSGQPPQQLQGCRLHALDQLRAKTATDHHVSHSSCLCRWSQAYAPMCHATSVACRACSMIYCVGCVLQT